MKVAIVKLANRGVPNREHLHLSVLAETDLSHYVVLDTSYVGPTAVRNIPENAFWFPSTVVRPGDQVILFTGLGKPNVQPFQGGSRILFFYWGLAKTIWNAPDDCAVVIEAGEWISSARESFSSSLPPLPPYTP